MLMKNVGHLSKTLLASATLEEALNGIGKTKRFRSGHIVFHAGDRNEGVFLVCNGKVCLRVPGAPHLDRVFSAGSVLGLPSTFNRQPYSLTAVCATDCEVAHVSEKEFLDLMAVRPDLCRESTAILSREVAFILSALAVRSAKPGVKESRRPSAPASGRPRPGSRHTASRADVLGAGS